MVSGQGHAWVALPREIDPESLVQETVSSPGPVWSGAECLNLTVIRSQHRSVRINSLYGLSCIGPRNWLD
jgi:hypothetical protein